MILPQFSLRMVLALVALLGVASLVLSRGLQGNAWAMGVSVALAALVFAFLTYAAAFGLIYLLAQVFRRSNSSLPRSVHALPGPGRPAASPTPDSDVAPSHPATSF